MSTVTCPSCECEFTPRRNKAGEGAQYVKDWKKLPDKLQRILAVWISKPTLRYEVLTKDRIFTELIKAGLFIKEDPFNARISELLGLGLITMVRYEKDSPHHNISIPKYFVSISKVTKILNNNGEL